MDKQKEYQRLLLKLRQARLDAGLNQVEVAKKMGKPQPYISKIESGEKKIDALELKKFAGIYKKPITYFLE